MNKLQKILNKYELDKLKIIYIHKVNIQDDGEYDEAKNIITIYTKEKQELTDTLIHELAHSVMYKQGYSLKHTKKFYNIMEELKNM